jgi:hypothetical protein
LSLSGAAAVPAIAAPPNVTTRVAATKRDPVFAAIERHRQAHDDAQVAWKEYADAEERLPKEFMGAACTPMPVNVMPDMDIDDP